MMGFNQLGGFGSGMMDGAGILVTIVVLATLIALFAMLTRRASGTISAQRDQRRMALEILDERYARGEIDTTEYRERLADLER